MSLGRTWLARSLGIGREDKKLLELEGMLDEDEKSRLYDEMLPCDSSGERWGEL